MKTRRRVQKRKTRKYCKQQRGGLTIHNEPIVTIGKYNDMKKFNIFKVKLTNIVPTLQSMYEMLDRSRMECITRCKTKAGKFKNGTAIVEQINSMYASRPVSESASFCNNLLTRQPNQEHGMCKSDIDSYMCICDKYMKLYNHFSNEIKKLSDFKKLWEGDTYKQENQDFLAKYFGISTFNKNVLRGGRFSELSSVIESIIDIARRFQNKLENHIEFDSIDITDKTIPHEYTNKTIEEIVNDLVREPSEDPTPRRPSVAPMITNDNPSNQKPSFARNQIHRRNANNRIAFASQLSFRR